MSQLSKRERVDAALKGDTVDRVPVSAWRHFLDEERQPETLARISLKHFEDYDWDWLKVNPRATYYAEAWGNQYDFGHYSEVFPKLVDGPINTADDLAKIQPVNPTGGVFAEQLELTRLIKAGIGDAHFLQTVFSPLSVLSFLVGRTTTHDHDVVVQAQYDGLRQYIHENPSGVHEALNHITATLAQYASAVVDAGASGLFFAIVKLARQGILSEAEYAEFGVPYDLQVLKAVQGAPFNLLHVCGPHIYFGAVADYPVHAINWATLAQHNLGLAEASQHTRKTLVGGIDEKGTLQTGSPDQVIQEALAAIRITNGHRLLLTPGCGTKVDVPAENLHALRKAVTLSPSAA